MENRCMNRIPILLCTDQNQVHYMGVVITSCILNAAETTAYDFHCIVAEDVEQGDMEKIEKFLEGGRHTVEFVRLEKRGISLYKPNAKYNLFHEYITETTFYTLLSVKP
jgi:lipopolysaccharide biosynthesis glycosyltransferase